MLEHRLVEQHIARTPVEQGINATRNPAPNGVSTANQPPARHSIPSSDAETSSYEEQPRAPYSISNSDTEVSPLDLHTDASARKLLSTSTGACTPDLMRMDL